MKNNLKQLRTLLGLTQEQFAAQSGVSVSFLSSFERDTLHSSSRNPKRSDEYHSNIERFLAQNNLTLSEQPEHIIPVHDFETGKVYDILKDKKINNRFTGSECKKEGTFIYIGKQGKHHIFKSVRGGWTRTYTDAQLIGKFISEVKN